MIGVIEAVKVWCPNLHGNQTQKRCSTSDKKQKCEIISISVLVLFVVPEMECDVINIVKMK